MIILGIDPGLRHTGWGVIQEEGSRLFYRGHGVIAPSPKLTLPERLYDLYEQLMAVVRTYHPLEAAVEETFVNKNANSSLKLGQARGIALLVPGLMGATVFEYGANQVKKSVTGAGHADKVQVAHMVVRLLTHCPAVEDDAADALGVAICHAHERHVHQMIKKVDKLSA